MLFILIFLGLAEPVAQNQSPCQTQVSEGSDNQGCDTVGTPLGTPPNFDGVPVCKDISPSCF